MEIVYKSRLVAKKNTGEKLCTLTEDKNFQITSKLDGEGGALTAFFSKFGSRKGLHVAIICAKKIDSDEISSLFCGKELKCKKNQCSNCPPMEAYKISVLDNTSVTEDRYQKGCYWDCIYLDNIHATILDVLQATIDCLRRLNKDVTTAEKQIDGLRCFSGPVPPEYLSQLADSIFSLNDAKSGYACVCILLILPERCFEYFNQIDSPVYIEYVVKGIVDVAEEYVKLSKKYSESREENEQLKKNQVATYAQIAQVDKNPTGQEASTTFSKEVKYIDYDREDYDIPMDEAEHDRPKTPKKFNPENENTEVR